MSYPRGGKITAVGIFDRYVTVDWSGANTPRAGKNSIWICSLAAKGGCWTRNPRTRCTAGEMLRDLLARSVGQRERVLIGFDFPFGYPAGFAAALGLQGEPWRAIWQLLAAEIIDNPQTNETNRFEVANDLNRRLTGAAAFWGRPQKRLLDHLPRTRDVTYQAAGTAAGLPEWRVVEQLLRRQGRRPHSAWKLLGSGSVGGQALTGIPAVAALRADPALADVSRVWPFELPAESPAGEPAIIHAEVWPSLYDFSAASGSCADEKQVRNLAGQLRRLDRGGALADMMRHAPRPSQEEGWILGVG